MSGSCKRIVAITAANQPPTDGGAGGVVPQEHPEDGLRVQVLNGADVADKVSSIAEGVIEPHLPRCPVVAAR